MTTEEALKQFRDYREDGVPESGAHSIPKEVQEECARQLGISLLELQSWRKSDIRDKIRAGEITF